MNDALQQQRVATRKAQILDAAALIFAQKGFHLTTTRDIAKQAGIAEGTIYTYFETKTALLLGIFERMRASIIQDAPPIPADVHDIRTFVRTMLYHPLMALKADNFALFRIVVSEMMVNEELRTLYFSHILEPTLKQAEVSFSEFAVKRGLSLTSARLMIRAISGMVLGLMIQHSMGDHTLIAYWDDLPDVIADLLVNGLQNEAH